MCKLKPAAIFSDNMVLQHGKPVPVWGWGSGTICVKWESGSVNFKTETVAENGYWGLSLPPLPACLKGELVITDGTDEIRLKNAVTGDVWFAGGQSNMEMELINCKNGEAELAACTCSEASSTCSEASSTNENIRFYQVVKRAVIDEDYLREEAASRWQICSPDTAAMLSAVAFFFARKINADLDIPVGIINCSWGGTSISTWMSREQLEKTRAGQRFIDDYNTLIGGKSDEQYNAEMENHNAKWREWDSRVRARKEKEPGVSIEVLNRECGKSPWPQPAGKTSPYCPTNLHTARILRAAPFALKGFLYYQGEEDAPLRNADYREMMYYLITQWRRDWHDNTLPFLFVQLPMFISRDEMESSNQSGIPPEDWCFMREAQYLASLDNANTGLAVIIDCGEFDNIHPLDKQTVGFRLALHALKKVYGKEIAADGPVFSYATTEGSTLRLRFSNAECGIEFRGNKGDIYACFEVSGGDNHYYPAKAEIDGNDVVLSSEHVTQPKLARYAWYKFGPTPLFAKNGLPAMPFRMG